MLTTDKKSRKEMPIARGVIDYFPLALAEIARVSYIGNQQHNPGQELHWARSKSCDHADCIARHLIERGTIDDDDLRHSAKLAWRALALLQEELELSAKNQAQLSILVQEGQAAGNYKPGMITDSPKRKGLANYHTYISGPMRGIKDYNFPAFDAAREALLELGHTVVSPADLDRDGKSFEADGSPKPIEFYAERDVQALLAIKRSGNIPAIYMLKGWEKSFGARAEKAIAEWMGFIVLYQE